MMCYDLYGLIRELLIPSIIILVAYLLCRFMSCLSSPIILTILQAVNKFVCSCLLHALTELCFVKMAMQM